MGSKQPLRPIVPYEVIIGGCYVEGKIDSDPRVVDNIAEFREKYQRLHPHGHRAIVPLAPHDKHASS